jgi:hypothetical protein
MKSKIEKPAKIPAIKVVKTPKPKKEDYVDNKEFHRLLTIYKNNPDDRKTYNELGKMFILIAKNFMNRTNFISYTQDRKDELLSEAVFTCVKYMHNFKPELNSSPFSYFTQCTFNAFVRVCKKNQLYAERYTSLDYVENGDGYARLCDDANSNLISTNTRNSSKR